MIRKLYPFGKKKAINFTYDDGVWQDIRFVRLLNQYRLKGTFNLNSALMERRFSWTHESGLVVTRLQPEVAAALYEGHEVASHTSTHPYMDGLMQEEIRRELAQDKASLERLFGAEVKGFAVPFDFYSEEIACCARECGFAYARISEESHTFRPQEDYYHWRATIFHAGDGLEGCVQRFLDTDEELALLQIVGHSYDLDVENTWQRMEAICQAVSSREEILPMTHIEIVEYIKAMDLAEITDRTITNRSPMRLWFAIDGKVREVKPGEVCICL